MDKGCCYMARKSYTGLDQFKKYRDNRKKAETFRKRSHRKAWSNLKKISRQKDLVRRKRMASYKNKHSSVSSEHESQRKGCTLFAVIGIIALVALFSLIGPFGILIIVLMAISALIIFIVKRTKKSVVRTLSNEEIDDLQRHLSNIDLYKDIANNSSNEYSVQYAMDELLKSIDYIMSYSEEELHQAEMSKAQLPEQKEFIKRNYNAMIEQARDRYKEENR